MKMPDRSILENSKSMCNQAYLGQFSSNSGDNRKLNLCHNNDDDIDYLRGEKVNVSKSIIYRQIGAKIAYYRTLRDLTQEALARKIHISNSTMSRIERGAYNKNVSVSLLLDISDGLKIDVAMLLTFSEQEKKMWWSTEDEGV